MRNLRKHEFAFKNINTRAKLKPLRSLSFQYFSLPLEHVSMLQKHIEKKKQTKIKMTRGQKSFLTCCLLCKSIAKETPLVHKKKQKISHVTITSN